MTARVAVLVPVFDQAAFLPRALGSLLAQDCGAFECVVVDDGSTDGPRVPDDPRVRLVRLPDNRGLGAALNAGLDATTGGEIGFVDDLQSFPIWLGAYGGVFLVLTEDRVHESAEGERPAAL